MNAVTAIATVGAEVLSLLGVLILGASAQQTTPIPVEEILRARALADYSTLNFSEDGKWLTFEVTERGRQSGYRVQEGLRTGVPFYAVGADIWVVNLATGSMNNLTQGVGDNWSPSWSPDSQYLALLSDRDGSGQAKLWVWDAARDQLRKVSDLDVRADEVQWVPKTHYMAVTVLPQGFSTNEYAQHISGVPRQEDESGTVRASTVTLYRSRTVEVPQLDAWSLDRHLRDLVSIDVDRGFAKTVIHGRRIAKYLPSPDGSRIAFTTDTRFEMPGSQQILFDLSVVNLSTGETRTVASGIRLNADSASLGWSPSGSYLAYQTVGVEANGDCYVVDTNSEQVRKVSNLPQAHSRYQRRAPLWDAASEHVYFLSDGGLWRAAPKGTDAVRVAKILNHRITELIAQNREHLLTGDGGTTTVVMTRNELTEQDGFYAIDLGSGKSTALIEANQCYTCVHTNSLVSASGDGRRFAFVAEDAQHASDVWLADAGFHRVRRLTHLNPDLDKYSMGSVRLIEWQNMDGELVKGALLLPADYREGQRYPLIARVYGGEFLQSDKLNRFGLEQGAVNNLQLLSSRGYAVLLPDAPQKIGTPMLDLAKSVLAGVNKVVEMGIADSNRLGLMGHSYGGYSVLSLIVQTKRFKVAAMSAGFGDLLAVYGQMGDDGSMIGMSLLEHGQGALGGSPWQFPEQYIENSPVFYLNRVQTPLLLLSGSDDNTVASHLSDEIFVDLRRLGKEAEYAKYRGEGHSVVSWSYANQLDYCNRLIEWFDRYLK